MAEREIIGLLNPGEMGAAVGECLTRRGHTVLWASDGRSEETTARAKAAGLTDARSVRQVLADAAVILSICPPHAALDVAWAVHGFTGLYVDANAISPGTAREVAQLITSNGGQYVDGGIIGPPPVAPGTTRLYLSGEQADKIKNLFTGTGLDPRIAAGPATAASAVKMAYAAWTKGTAALLLAARALARAEGVEDALLAEWALSQPQLADQSGRAARLGRHEGLALGRRDGGDRPVHGRGRPAGRIPPGRRRDLPPLPAPARLGRRRRSAAPGPRRGDRLM